MKKGTTSSPPSTTVTSRDRLFQLQDLLQFGLPLTGDALHSPLLVHLNGYRLIEVKVRRQSPIGSLERLGVTRVGPDRYRDIADVLSHNINDVPLDRLGAGRIRHQDQAAKGRDAPKRHKQPNCRARFINPSLPADLRFDLM